MEDRNIDMADSVHTDNIQGVESAISDFLRRLERKKIERNCAGGGDASVKASRNPDRIKYNARAEIEYDNENGRNDLNNYSSLSNYARRQLRGDGAVQSSTTRARNRNTDHSERDEREDRSDNGRDGDTNSESSGRSQTTLRWLNNLTSRNEAKSTRQAEIDGMRRKRMRKAKLEADMLNNNNNNFSSKSENTSKSSTSTADKVCPATWLYRVTGRAGSKSNADTDEDDNEENRNSTSSSSTSNQLENTHGLKQAMNLKAKYSDTSNWERQNLEKIKEKMYLEKVRVESDLYAKEKHEIRTGKAVPKIDFSKYGADVQQALDTSDARFGLFMEKRREEKREGEQMKVQERIRAEQRLKVAGGINSNSLMGITRAAECFDSANDNVRFNKTGRNISISAFSDVTNWEGDLQHMKMTNDANLSVYNKSQVEKLKSKVDVEKICAGGEKTSYQVYMQAKVDSHYAATDIIKNALAAQVSAFTDPPREVSPKRSGQDSLHPFAVRLAAAEQRAECERALNRFGGGSSAAE